MRAFTSRSGFSGFGYVWYRRLFQYLETQLQQRASTPQKRNRVKNYRGVWSYSKIRPLPP